MANTNPISNQKFISDDNIDLKEFFKLILRNKWNISLSSIIFFIFACIFALSQKRVWEGKFEIVLNNSENGLTSNLLRSNMALISNLNLFNSNSNLNTEVGILKSPSVLLPIFNYVNDERKKNNPDFIEIPFTKWKKNNLKIELKPSTSILNITYKDSNKKIILPVLSKISFAYQEYSGKSTKRNITLAKEYLNTQITKYKIKSSESLRNAQAFALDQDLTILTQIIGSEKDSNSQDQLKVSSFSSINIEKIRVAAANNIRNIDKQIENINAYGDDYEKLQFIGRNIIGFKNREDAITKELDKIETRLAEVRSKYTEKDRTILRLEEKRKILIKLLKNRVVGYLNAQRIVEKAKMESAKRPKDVILNYKELIRLAARDESTLIELENQLRMINLEEARYKDPWELVTKPTLKKSAVAPKRKQIGLIGLFFGIFTGTVLAVIKDIKSDKVFTEKDIEKILMVPIFKMLKLNKDSIEEDNNLLNLNEMFNLNEGNLNFISMNNLNDKFAIVEKYLINSNNRGSINKNFNFLKNNFSSISNKDTTVVLASMVNLKYKDLNNFAKRLNLLNIKVDGIILVN